MNTYNDHGILYGTVPKCISDLSDVETKVLSQILANVSVVFTKYGKHKRFKGHCINFMQDL